MPLDNQNPPLDSNTRDPYLDEELPEGYEDICPDCGASFDECDCDDEEEEDDDENS